MVPEIIFYAYSQEDVTIRQSNLCLYVLVIQEDNRQLHRAAVIMILNQHML